MRSSFCARASPPAPGGLRTRTRLSPRHCGASVLRLSGFPRPASNALRQRRKSRMLVGSPISPTVQDQPPLHEPPSSLPECSAVPPRVREFAKRGGKGSGTPAAPPERWFSGRRDFRVYGYRCARAHTRLQQLRMDWNCPGDG